MDRAYLDFERLHPETTTVDTDEAQAYASLPNHETVSHGFGQYVDGMAHTNGLESLWSLMKRGYHGNYHKMSRKHLPRYVGEFSGRHNDRPAGTHEQNAPHGPRHGRATAQVPRPDSLSRDTLGVESTDERRRRGLRRSCSRKGSVMKNDAKNSTPEPRNLDIGPIVADVALTTEINAEVERVYPPRLPTETRRALDDPSTAVRLARLMMKTATRTTDRATSTFQCHHRPAISRTP